jgi:hypothetical protein
VERRRDPGRGATAIGVAAAGVAASLSALSGAALMELVPFLFVSVCALLLASRTGALVLTLVMAVLAVWSNHDISASASPTGRAIGTSVLIFLLFVIAIVGICVDIVAGLAWRSAHWRAPDPS